MTSVIYPKRVETKMKALFGSLSEKNRRRYAAVEADKLGHGGIEYVSALFGIDSKTIQRGISDLADAELLIAEGERKKGAVEKVS
jgi:hypothetical protein